METNQPKPGQPQADEDAVQTRINAQLEGALRRLETESQRVEIETRVAIQEKSKRWITASAGFLMLALGILAFFGFREIWNLEKRAEDLTQRMEISAEQALERVVTFEGKLGELELSANAKASGVEQKIAEAEENLRTARQEMEAARGKMLEAERDFQRQLDRLKLTRQLLDEGRDTLDEAKRLTAEYEKSQALVNTKLAEIERLQNSFFNIYVAYQGTIENRNAILSPLFERLREGGYKVLPENVIDSTVDRTELIYYEDPEPSQVEEVHAIMQETLCQDCREPIPRRYIVSSNPRDILLKVRAADTP